MKVLMVGASNGGEMLGDILVETTGIKDSEIFYLDDNKDLWGKKISNRSVLDCATTDLGKIVGEFSHGFISIALHKLMPFRVKMFVELSKHLEMLNIIHPTAYISDNAKIGSGNYVGAFSYVGPRAEIGDCNFFSAHTTIEHHSKIGSYNSWGPANSTSGMCEVGDYVCMGSNISMIYNVSIGDHSTVASDVGLSKSVGSCKVVRKSNFPGVHVGNKNPWRIDT